MDEVVTTTQFRDYLIVITRQGRIYKIVLEDHCGFPMKIMLVGGIDLRQ